MGTFLIIGILFFLALLLVFYLLTSNNLKISTKNTDRLSDIQKDFLEKRKKRIEVVRNEIYIQNHHLYSGISDRETKIITLEGTIPEIKIFENDQLIKTFRIEPKNDNPNLNGQIFECEIHVHGNFSVQIEGAIYVDMEHLLYKKDVNKEYVRFQPFHLSHRKENDEKLLGRGMIARGLHYFGHLDGGNIRLICVCDHCHESFSVDFYHAGFSDAQYFYSTHSKETTMISFDTVREMPNHYQQDIDENKLEELEKRLPKTQDGEFKYYNPFCCPHCLAPFNDYQKFKEDRLKDIYAHFYLNQSPVSYETFFDGK